VEVLEGGGEALEAAVLEEGAEAEFDAGGLAQRLRGARRLRRRLGATS
jgi:hypothetical protein